MPSYELKIIVEGQDRGATGMLSGLKGALGDIGKIAGGVLLAGGIAKLGQSISGLAKDALGAVSAFQQFSVGLETMVAREAVLAGAFDNIGDALEGIGGNVQALQADLRDLALSQLRVFSPEIIQNTFRLNMAYGASIQMSKDLTSAILNTGAALGLSNEMISRLNYNLAQALVAGDLTAINLRQLKLVGLDLARVLREELGLSIEQIREQLKSGQITLQEVSEAFMKYADENFGGAAERLGRTIAGVGQSIKNLFQFAAIDLLTPSLNEVAGALNDLFDAGKGVLDSGVLTVIGEELGNITHSAIEAGRSFLDEFGGRMAQAAQSAFQWGVNISTQLAAGIIEGAVAVLTAAMDFISGLLASWLGPGSPPKIAPDIDKWGAAAFSEFLHGFGEADWGIMDSIGYALESTFRTLVDIGAMAAEDLGPAMVSLSRDLAGALAEYGRTGEVSAGIFEKLRELGGQFGKELEDLARKQFSLVDATKAYESVVKAFDKAAESEKRAREEAALLSTEYEELVATRAPKRLLRQKRAEMDAAQARLKAAEDERKKLEDQKSAAQDRMDLLRQQVRWQEKLLVQLQEMFRWQKKQEELEDKATKGLKAAKIKAPKIPKLKGAKDLAGAIELPTPDFTPMVAGVNAAVDNIREKLAGLIPEEARNNIQRIKDALTDLKDSWDRFAGAIAAVWTTYIKPWIDKILGLIPKELIDNIAWVTGAILGFKVALALLAIPLGIITGLIGGISSPILAIIVALALLKTAWDSNWGGIRDKAKWAWEEIKKWWETTGKVAFQDVKDFITDEVVPKLEEVWLWFAENIPAAFETLKGFWESTLQPALIGLWNLLTIFVIPTLINVYNWLIDKLVAAFTAVKAYWDEHLSKTLIDCWERFKDIVDVLEKVFKWLYEKLMLAFDEIEIWWNQTGYNLFGKMLEMFGNIAGAIQNAVNFLRDLITLQGSIGPDFDVAVGGGIDPNAPIIDPGDWTGQQFGGFWRRGGLARLHSNEVVLPLGNQVGINALARAMEKALGGQGQTPLYIQTVNVYSNDAEDMLAQLQALSVPGRGI